MSELGIRPTTEYLKEYFKNKSVEGVEIGVFKGLNAERMIDMLNISKLHLVDLWITPECLKHQYNLEQFYLDVCEKFKSNSNIFIYRENSIKASELFDNESLDFVYVDADHTYEGCLNDIRAWLPKVKKNGIICGHDYYCCDGVYQAVNELFKSDDIITFDATGIYDNCRYGEWLVIKRCWIKYNAKN